MKYLMLLLLLGLPAQARNLSIVNGDGPWVEKAVIVYYADSVTTHSATHTIMRFNQSIIDAGCPGQCVHRGNDWKFIAPRDGFYRMRVQVQTNSNFAAGEQEQWFLYKNDVNDDTYLFQHQHAGTSGDRRTLNGEAVVYMFKGDHMNARFGDDLGSGSPSYGSVTVNIAKRSRIMIDEL